jgi:uncharacterized protein
MLLFDKDDEYLRPVGAETPAGRFPFRLRQIVTVMVVLLLGGGFGSGAYFLSSLDVRDILSVLDVGDPHSQKLSFLMPNKGEGAKSAAPGGPLLSPPRSGEDAAPPPAGGGPALPPGIGSYTASSPPISPPPPPPPQPVVIDLKPVVLAAIPAPMARAVDKPPSFAMLPPPAEIKPLPDAPAKDLLRDSPNGALPVVAADGRQPWKIYGRPFDGDKTKPRVAVVITDLGLDRNATEAAIAKLPGEVSLAFSPYAVDLPRWLKRARDAGHEVLVTLPVETVGASMQDAGSLGLLLTNTPEINTTRLEKVLARSAGSVGVLAPSSRFAAAPQVMEPVFATLLQRGLFYLGEGARSGRVPAAAPISLIVDQDPWREAIDARLAATVAALRNQGGAVLVASARPVTLDRLTAWLATLPEQGVLLAPATALAKPPGGKP